MPLKLSDELGEDDTEKVGVPDLDTEEQPDTVTERLIAPLFVPDPLNVPCPVLDAHLVGKAIVRDELGVLVGSLLVDGVTEMDLDELEVPVDLLDAELHWDDLGERDSELVTLGLKEVRGDELGEEVMEFETVPVRETVPLTVCVRVAAKVKELDEDEVKLTVTHPVGVPLLLREEKGEGEKEALPVGLLDTEELPLDMREEEPLLVTLAGVEDTLIVALPHLLTEEEKEEDLEALGLPLGRRVAEAHNEARGEREDDTVTLGLRVALGDALVVVEKDTEGVSETEGVVVGVIERV